MVSAEGGRAPGLSQALIVGDTTRRALLKLSDGLAVFAGKNARGEPLRGHQHLHVLSESLRADGGVSHLLLWAPMGFGEAAQGAIELLKKIWSNRAPRFDITLHLLGFGEPADFAGFKRRAGHSRAAARARVWRSVTPFVATRHPKTHKDGRAKLVDLSSDLPALQIGSPPHDLLRLLKASGYPLPRRISPLSAAEARSGVLSWSDFWLQRPRGAGRRSAQRGSGFELEFPEPISGPICLGYGAHAGLGCFEAAFSGSGRAENANF